MLPAPCSDTRETPSSTMPEHLGHPGVGRDKFLIPTGTRNQSQLSCLTTQTLKLLQSSSICKNTETIKTYPAPTGRTTNIPNDKKILYSPYIVFNFVYLTNIMCIIHQDYHVNYLKGLIYLCEYKTTVTKAQGVSSVSSVSSNNYLWDLQH